MNPRTNIFSGFGVYTRAARGVDNPDYRRGGTFIRDTVISPSPHMRVFSGMGAGPCPTNTLEFPAGSGFCVPTFSLFMESTSTCPAGMAEPWPGARFCLPTVGSTPMIPGPCPAGMFGVPPYCFPIGTPLPPGAVLPPSMPAPTPPPTPTPPPEGMPPDATKDDWVVPVVVGVGVIALVGIAVASRSRKATPNRRRRRRR